MEDKETHGVQWLLLSALMLLLNFYFGSQEFKAVCRSSLFRLGDNERVTVGKGEGEMGCQGLESMKPAMRCSGKLII